MLFLQSHPFEITLYWNKWPIFCRKGLKVWKRKFPRWRLKILSSKRVFFNKQTKVLLRKLQHFRSKEFTIKCKNILVTRMHSTRIRTVQCSGRLMGGGGVGADVGLGGVCLGVGVSACGVSAQWGGGLPGGVCTGDGGLPGVYAQEGCLPGEGVCLSARGVYTSPTPFCGQNSWHLDTFPQRLCGR